MEFFLGTELPFLGSQVPFRRSDDSHSPIALLGLAPVALGEELKAVATRYPPHMVLAEHGVIGTCLLYTSDAADDLLCVDLGGRRIIQKKT